MKAFINRDFLLTNETARLLYHDYAKKLPIIDYHCHINPKDIAQDRVYNTITELWLGDDHYKWRAMRSNGIAEDCITGNASDYEKFYAYASTMPKLIGNPLYHWTHLELRRYFDYKGILSANTADEVYKLCNEKLSQSKMSVRGIIEQSNVEVICTTDDPIDSLEYHEQIAKDSSFAVAVLPAWRPDKAIGVDRADFATYISKLEECSGTSIHCFSTLCEALSNRLDFFAAHGCKVSDHAIDPCVYARASKQELDEILAKALAGNAVTPYEAAQFKTQALLFLGGEYHKRGWIMQLHMGTIRNNSDRMFSSLGADTGFDAIRTNFDSSKLSSLLNALDLDSRLPKTILYSLHPADNEVLCSLAGCFQSSDAVGKIQHGSAWWFNDSKLGMLSQLTSLANIGVLGTFIGMLTDSRSFLSYTRHEYFRRILCNLFGEWVEKGEYPNDLDSLSKLVSDISYNNCKRYFGF